MPDFWLKQIVVKVYRVLKTQAMLTQCALFFLFLEVALFDTQWRRDVSLKITRRS